MSAIEKVLISNLYDEEKKSEEKNNDFLKITVKVSPECAALFTCVANRFGKNRFDLIAPILESGAKNVFDSLSSTDRENISILADEEASRLREKNNPNPNSTLQASKIWQATLAFGDYEK